MKFRAERDRIDGSMDRKDLRSLCFLFWMTDLKSANLPPLMPIMQSTRGNIIRVNVN